MWSIILTLLERKQYLSSCLIMSFMCNTASPHSECLPVCLFLCPVFLSVSLTQKHTLFWQSLSGWLCQYLLGSCKSAVFLFWYCTESVPSLKPRGSLAVKMYTNHRAVLSFSLSGMLAKSQNPLPTFSAPPFLQLCLSSLYSPVCLPALN